MGTADRKRIVSGSAYSTPGSAARRREVAATDAPERFRGSFTTDRPSAERRATATGSPASRSRSAATGAAPGRNFTMIWSVARASPGTAGSGAGTASGAAPEGAASPVRTTETAAAPATTFHTARPAPLRDISSALSRRPWVWRRRP